MKCPSCGSGDRAKFPAEIAIHHEGLKNLDEPPVLLWPEIWVCPHCGEATFAVPDAELRLLVKDSTASAVVRRKREQDQID
jgi:hypothetical protein